MQLCVAQNHSPEVGLVQARTPQIGSLEFGPSELRSRQVTMMLKRPLLDHIPAVGSPTHTTKTPDDEHTRGQGVGFTLLGEASVGGIWAVAHHLK